MKRRNLLAIFLFVLLLPTGAGAVFPDHPVKLIVPYPPGGGADVVARIVAERMSKVLNQPVIVENRAGASGNIGMEVAARSRADGYTMVNGTAGQAINMSFFPKLSYDLIRDFAPISLMVTNQRMLAVGRHVSATTLRDFLAQARTRKFSYASFGNGSSAHMAGEMLKQQAGIDMLHVPYKGDRPALNDLLGGNVDAMIGDVATLVPHVQSGKLKGLGIASRKRFAGLPEVPTLSEAGLPGYETNGWLGLYVPAGTPGEAITILNDAVVKALADGETRKKLEGLGSDPIGNSPAEFARFTQDEVTKWANVVKASGAKPD